MEQIDNRTGAASTIVYAHYPPGTVTGNQWFVLTNLTTDEVVQGIAVFVRQNDRAVQLEVPGADLDTGMWQLQFKADSGSEVLFTALAYLSDGADTAVPSDPSTYTTGDTDRYTTYYE